MDIWGIAIILSIILIIVGTVIYFLNKWAGKRTAEQQEMVAQHKQTVSIYVIDKKKDKIANANFPKAVLDQMPKMSKLMKMPLVKAKIGPQIMTLMCDAAVFDALPTKKTVAVEMAGAYIVSMKGMKTKMQMQEMRNARRKGGNAQEEPQTFTDKLKARFKK